MGSKTDVSGTNLLRVFYVYIFVVMVALLALIFVRTNSVVLKEFRGWVSTETINDRLLVLLALMVITGIFVFLSTVLAMFFTERLNPVNILWFLFIVFISLFVSTFLAEAWNIGTGGITPRIIIVLLTNVITVTFTYVYFKLNYTKNVDFLAFLLGILAVTSAFNWIFLSSLVKIAL